MDLLGRDEFGMSTKLVTTNDDNYTTPENVPEITNQDKVMYNVDWCHDDILWRCPASARNHNTFVHFTLNIKTSKLQRFQMFSLGYFIEGVLLYNTNKRI